jgi:ribosomal protein L29
MLKAEELRAKDLGDLKELENKVRKELLNIKLQLAAGGIKDRSLVGKKKKDLARILTISNEKKRGVKN